VTIRYRAPNGTLATRSFTTWHSDRGPIVRESNGRWIAFAMMDKPVAALQQSFLRTKTRDLNDFLKVANLQANSSNNTIFASRKGEIAYLHPQFVPRRDGRFDYTRPVDGSDPATDWGALHAIADLPNVMNPQNGWVHNENNWPYRAAGPNSPDPKRFPTYMDLFGKGTFTGKGLYDVDAFRATADRAFPDNHILSHDLIESNYCRCALATDVEVFDEFPARYHAFARRDHRWSSRSQPLLVELVETKERTHGWPSRTSRSSPTSPRTRSSRSGASSMRSARRSRSPGPRPTRRTSTG
jgi:hypothetical protein